MSESKEKSSRIWSDPDDAPEWSDEQLSRAELAVGGKIVRPAQGTLTRPLGRPALTAPKKHINLRVDPVLLERFRATGKGWQSRMHKALEEWFIHHPDS